MRWTLCLLALAACSPRQAATSDPGTLTGTVVAVDLSPLAYDGDARIDVRPDDGRDRVVVHIPARQNLCAATLESDLSSLSPGDRVEVRGAATRAGGVTPCESADHRFVVTERAAPQDGQGELTGVVTQIDLAPMAFDGDALIEVQTERGASRTVRIPARERQCEAPTQAIVDVLAVGDRVEVRGALGADGDVTPCAAPSHYIRILS